MMKELKKDLGCLCIMTVVSALAIGLRLSLIHI